MKEYQGYRIVRKNYKWVCWKLNFPKVFNFREVGVEKLKIEMLKFRIFRQYP